MRRLLFAAALVAAAGAAVMAAQNPPPLFKSTSRLIIQLVTVRDAHGNPVTGLTAKDFVLTEDDVPQDVAFAEYQAIQAETSGSTPARPLVRAQTSAAAAASASGDDLAAVTATAPFVPKDDRYRGRRLLVFYIDLYQMSFFDKMRTFDQARRYVAQRMTDADLVAVMVFDGTSARVAVDFTDDRLALVDVIDRLAASAQTQDSSGVIVAAASAFGEDNDTFNIFATDRQLAALQTAVAGFGPVPELKTLIYFGSGLRLNGTDNMAQLRATVNAAVRANVTLNPIDARGLSAEPPMGDATRASSSGTGLFSGALAQAQMVQRDRSKDALYAIAKDTGGKAFFDANDLSLGIAQAANAVTGYYMLGFYSTHNAADGKYRKVKVALRAGLTGELSYRAGYYGEKPYETFTRADKERQLADALRSDDPITDIPMAAAVNYFQVSPAEYFVPVSVRMPGSDLLRSAGKTRTGKIELDVINEIKDEYGVTQRNLRDRVEIPLDPAAAASAAARPVQYETGFTVLPGAYSIKVLARDIATGRIGTYQTTFVVPNLEREARALPTSSVVLSAESVSTTSALFSVKQKVASDHVNPLIHDGVKLVPSVSRVFNRSVPLHVLLYAYGPAAAPPHPLVASVAFYRDGALVFETTPAQIAGAGGGTPPAVPGAPIRLTVSLSSLPPGAYECQVNVLDPAGARASFARIEIVVE